jgi:hypothetical protein
MFWHGIRLNSEITFICVYLCVSVFICGYFLFISRTSSASTLLHYFFCIWLCMDEYAMNVDCGSYIQLSY